MEPFETQEKQTMELEAMAAVGRVDPAARDAVIAALMRRDATRARRREEAAAYTPREFTDALDRVRTQIAESAILPRAKRDVSFAELADDDLVVLEGRLARYEAEGRLAHENGSVEVARMLNPLRVNFVTGRDAIACDDFRAIARGLFAAHLPHAVAFAIPTARIEQMPHVAPHVVGVLPWRAALIAGEVARTLGITEFWHLGIERNERDLVPSRYAEHPPHDRTRSWLHLVCEPMLATGGTLEMVLELLRTRGVSMAKVVIASVVAAPEGVDRILHAYPDVRIMTAALDAQLNADGYISGPGLGDFGDLAMQGITSAYAEERWVCPGFLTRMQVGEIFARTARIACERRLAATR